MRLVTWIGLALMAGLMAGAPAAFGHEIRPGFLQITEQEAGRYKVLWKAPSRSGMAFRIKPILPDSCRDQIVVVREQRIGSLVERRVVDCGPGGLAGKTIRIDGLEATITDVLVRVHHQDGQAQTILLKPDDPSFEVQGSQSWSGLAASYLTMGVEHILYGIDHLLFVLGLLLLCSGWVLLLKTITAFTVGHSLSLAAATLGFVNVPGPPLSAAIALSIVFLAGELVRARRGETSLTIDRPWVVSFGFGMLHGLGFAAALVALGLPKPDIPLALLWFNVGVEIGQLIFVAAALLLLGSLRKMGLTLPHWARLWPAYAMGSVAAFWFVGRVAVML